MKIWYHCRRRYPSYHIVTLGFPAKDSSDFLQLPTNEPPKWQNPPPNRGLPPEWTTRRQNEYTATKTLNSTKVNETTTRLDIAIAKIMNVGASAVTGAAK